jgi:hypothetical protein
MDPASQPLKRLIIVVCRDQPELYARMRQQYSGVAFVTLDRRLTERRWTSQGVEPDRRGGDRRQPWTRSDMDRWRRLGYRLLYRATGVTVGPTD